MIGKWCWQVKGLWKFWGQNQATCISHHFANKSEASDIKQPQASTKPKVQINTRSDFSTGVSQILVFV